MSSSPFGRSLATGLAVALVTAAGQPALAQAEPPTRFTMDSGHPRTAEQVVMRFDHAALAIRLTPDTRTIAATATHRFTALAPLDQLVLELDRNLAISTVRIDGAVLSPEFWTNPNGRLAITLPRPLQPMETVEAEITYAGAPHVAENAPWSGGFVWSETPDGQPWIATAVQGEGCDLFWPCIDHPLGEPAVMDLAITAPPGLSAVSNGALMGVETGELGWSTWRWRVAQPDTYAIALNVGPYEELAADYHSRWGNRFPMRFWHLAGDDAGARGLFAEFPRQLEFYERLIGPYPFADEKMGVVETPHLGMEHQTINAYGNAYAKDANGFDWLLHHELAHEWFGNQMTNADWRHMWLHEGFATYMQPLYARELHGERNFQAGMHDQRVLIANRFPLVPASHRTAKEIYDAERGPGLDIYYKGSHVLHTLRLLIGDAAFWAATRQLVYGRPDPEPGNFQPRHVTTADFIAAVNATTGEDMSWFFDAYVFQAALPDLVTTRAGGRMTLEWVTGGDAPFPMPLEVEVDGTVRTVAMAGGRGELAVPESAVVVIDPGSKVLRRSVAIEEFQQWRRDQAAP